MARGTLTGNTGTNSSPWKHSPSSRPAHRPATSPVLVRRSPFGPPIITFLWQHSMLPAVSWCCKTNFTATLYFRCHL